MKVLELPFSPPQKQNRETCAGATDFSGIKQCWKYNLPMTIIKADIKLTVVQTWQDKYNFLKTGKWHNGIGA